MIVCQDCGCERFHLFADGDVVCANAECGAVYDVTEVLEHE